MQTLKQAGSIIAARIITVPDEAELAVRKAKDTTGFAASDFSAFAMRVSDGSHLID